MATRAPFMQAEVEELQSWAVEVVERYQGRREYTLMLLHQVGLGQHSIVHTDFVVQLPNL